ncbi:hypothetical protein BC938DRAFT_480085 [Jimgerdemannia flammicorona]|uniref:UspA domain-containing protein n=1 Tax=Jimgerdemannia flammicorona TaxID=994334 RepID=A0A433QJF5_9FUNG|nr:hypothetical protein BC938DRAFT_480085 [Jimgerdemannia flammicorona]
MSVVPIDQRRKIALAYDGSDDARNMFKWAISNILKPGEDHVTIISVLPDTRRPSQDNASEAPQHTPAQASLIERVRDLARELNTHHLTTQDVVLYGDPRVSIPKFTRETTVDLLIMGSRGLGQVKSVSDRCVHECVCPVLVVRPNTK